MNPEETLRAEAERLLEGITSGRWQAEMSGDDGRHRIERVLFAASNYQVGLAGKWEDAEFIAAAPRLVRDLLAQVQTLQQARENDEARLRSVPDYGRLGIGVEAWVDLHAAERDATARNLSDRSQVSLRWPTVRVVLALLRHMLAHGYPLPPLPKGPTA